MAENQDNNEIEYMTNKEEISYPQDIDVIFNDDDDDNVNLIIPDYNDMKDFENNSQDDFISDDDLDFVDSVDFSSHDLDVVFEDDEPIEVDDNPVLEIREEVQEEAHSIINIVEEDEKSQFEEPESYTEPLIQAEDSPANSETVEISSEQTEEDEIINLDEEEEPAELQDVIVIEQETKSEDIEIISPPLPEEEINPPEVEPDEVISLDEPEDVGLTEEIGAEPSEDVVVLEEPTVDEELTVEPAIVEETSDIEEIQDFVIDTKVETELVDSALNELNNSSDFEIIEENEINDIPLKLEEETLKEEETHNFTIDSEPEVVAAETFSDDYIIKSVLFPQNTEKENEKTEEEEILEETVFAVSNIDETRGFYFAKNEQTFAFFGYINDEIFLLKDFQELYDKNLGIRLEERKFYSESYLVKVNSQKFLVEVDETSMRIAMEF